MDLTARRQAFRQLHASGCFVIPNPWDAGSARYLQGLGFKALATTSSGAAWSRAKPDGGMGLEDTLAHLREMVAATELPVNADFEGGFADDAAGVARNVRAAIDTGVSVTEIIRNDKDDVRLRTSACSGTSGRGLRLRVLLRSR